MIEILHFGLLKNQITLKMIQSVCLKVSVSLINKRFLRQDNESKESIRRLMFANYD